MKYCLIIIRKDQLSPDVRLFITANDAMTGKRDALRNENVVAVYLYKYVTDWRRYNGKTV